MRIDELRRLFRPKSRLDILLTQSEKLQLLPQIITRPRIRINLNQEDKEKQADRENYRTDCAQHIYTNGIIDGTLKRELRRHHEFLHKGGSIPPRHFGTCYASFILPQPVTAYKITKAIGSIPNKYQVGLTSMQIANLGLVDSEDGHLRQVQIAKAPDSDDEDEPEGIIANVYSIGHENMRKRSFNNCPLDGELIVVSRELARELGLRNRRRHRRAVITSTQYWEGRYDAIK